VKVRGQRVDLLEVEVNLRALPGVAAAAVALLLPDSAGGAGGGAGGQMVAYVVLSTSCASMVASAEAELSALRQLLAWRVPPYALPALFLPCAALPLLPNGKLDRAILRRPLSDSANPAHAAYRAASSRQAPISDASSDSLVRTRIAAMWSELGLLVVSDHADFFSSGGDSLRLVTLVSQVIDRFLYIFLNLDLRRTGFIPNWALYF
jgi:hypothetical protein